MYLTRLTLDPRSVEARRDLGDPYEMHRTLTRAFVPDAKAKPLRYLWRLEPVGNSWTPPVVLVQSAAKANWNNLSTLPNYLNCPAETKEVDYGGLIIENGCFRFRLLANPTVTREGKRYGLVGESEQLAWLARQGDKHGFEIEAAVVSASDVLDSSRAVRHIIIQRARFEGVLRSHNAKSLKQAVITGIGPAKAFGCGLLSLARR